MTAIVRRHPNFFIVGAPKCGTTSLYAYLRTHPSVFMASVKEPHYFAGDLREANYGAHYRESLDGYLALFERASGSHAAIGEASVWYLYAPGSLERILEFSPKAKIIAMVRNPIEMAPSLHAQLLANGQEYVREFSKAWSRPSAVAGAAVCAKSGTDPRLLDYRDTCALGTQIDNLFRVVPESQRKVVVLDDLVRNAREAYLDVLNFLDIPDDGRMEFPVVNERNRVVRPKIAGINQRLPRWKWWIRTKRRLGFPYYSPLRIPRWVYLRHAGKTPIPQCVRDELVRSFRLEIQKLARLLRRNLDAWLVQSRDLATK